ncbi:hypothetical protein HDU82_000965 [Entophlyctis luteolus]|nr:hypothetical protein HDU82_000965 [Entophlyctis luteolus]
MDDVPKAMPVHPEKADCTVTIADELSLGFAVTVKQNIEDGHIELDDTMAATFLTVITASSSAGFIAKKGNRSHGGKIVDILSDLRALKSFEKLTNSPFPKK